MLVGPLALLALIRGKRKVGKSDQILVVIMVLMGVSLSCVSTGTVTLTPTPIPSSTPSPTGTEPVPDQGRQTPTPGSTPPATATPIPLPCPTPTLTPTPTPTPEEPTIQPPGVDDILWDTYVKLRDFRSLTAGKYTQKWKTDWWRKEDGDDKFTLVDFFDRLLQFELIGAKDAGEDILKEVAVGNYCFWTTREKSRNDEWLLRRPCGTADLRDSAEISRYIMSRGLLNIGKDYTIKDDLNYDAWIMWPINLEDRSGTNQLNNIDFESAFLNPPNERWLDWSNVNWKPGMPVDDPLTEWGNSDWKQENGEVFNKDFYDRVKASTQIRGRKTTQIGANWQTWYAFTYCQNVYYDGHGMDSNKKCDDPARR